MAQFHYDSSSPENARITFSSFYCTISEQLLSRKQNFQFQLTHTTSLHWWKERRMDFQSFLIPKILPFILRKLKGSKFDVAQCDLKNLGDSLLPREWNVERRNEASLSPARSHWVHKAKCHFASSPSCLFLRLSREVGGTFDGPGEGVCACVGVCEPRFVW